MESVKKTLLLFFVLAGVVLVLLIWVQGFSDTGTSGAATLQRDGGAGSPLVSSQTPQPQMSLPGKIVSTPENTVQTPSPAVTRTQSTSPTPTLSQEEINILMTAETDQ
jgi:hypothetical protein